MRGVDGEDMDEESELERDRGRSVGDRVRDARQTLDDARELRDKLDRVRGKGTKKSAAPQTKAGARPTSGRPVPVATTSGRAAGATAGRGAAATATRTGLGLVLRNPYVLLALTIILLIVGVFLAVSFGGQNKAIGQIGGSPVHPLDYDNPEHQQLVSSLASLTIGDDPVIEFAAGVEPRDLVEWKQGEGGSYYHALDWRVVKTLEYLTARGWDKIVLGILSSNGPDKTRRQMLNKNNQGDFLDAISAYAGGQAMGIVAIGRTSSGLTDCLQLPSPVPVSVAWQETLAENFLRSVYGPLEVDAGNLYLEYQLHMALLTPAERRTIEEGGEGLADLGRPMSGESRQALGEIQKNLQRVVAASNQWHWNDETVKYANQALTALGSVNVDKLVSTRRELRSGLASVFRMMQVANMAGWQGSRDDNCRLWMAYEARQNIRKLTLDLMRMPVELATATQGDTIGFDPAMVVKQVIVYSPEDDLDNGLPDTDVFPRGAVAVDMGGVGYDPTKRDNRIDAGDNHFLALPQDNGILTKPSTIFTKGRVGTEAASEDLKVRDTARNQLHEFWDNNYSSLGRVGYKNFVHIGF